MDLVFAIQLHSQVWIFTIRLHWKHLYVDLHIDEILDANMYSLQYSKNKRLKATIPKRVDMYLKLVEKKWDDQNIEKRFDKLRLLSYTDDRCKFELEINKIDQNISECTSLPTRNLLQWSPALKNALDLLIECRMLRAKMQYVRPGQTIEEAQNNYKAACSAYDEALQQYKVVKTKHIELRNDYMKSLAMDLAEQNLTDEAVELKN